MAGWRRLAYLHQSAQNAADTAVVFPRVGNFSPT